MKRSGVSARLVSMGIAVVAALAAAPAWAGFSATDCFLPSVGRGKGANSSQWYTTMWIYNPQSSPVNVQIFFLKRNQPNPHPLTYNDTIPAGDVRKYENAVFTLFGVEGFGALRVTANQRVVVNARIFSQPTAGEKASVGQFMGAAPASFAIGNGEKTQLLGLYQTTPKSSSTYRYNYGFVETTGGSATVKVRAIDEHGTELASDTLTMGGFEAQQYNVKDRLLGSPNVTNARIEVQVTGGSGKVIAFGTGLANASNDSSVFEMQFADSLLAENSGGGLTLPYSGTVNTADFAFKITNRGSGMALGAISQSSSENSAAIAASATASVGITGHSDTNYGVVGDSGSGGGVLGVGGGGSGVAGISSSGNAGVFRSSGDTDAVLIANDGNGRGLQVTSSADTGVWVNTAGTSAFSGLDVRRDSDSLQAGYFRGSVTVTGNLTKGSGSFKIDHPLDPAHRYLSHSFVESPDMMNVYNGNVALDGRGTAWVELPGWFEALNRDFRYQLTAVSGPMPNLWIGHRVEHNRFEIAGGTPGGEVSWQVTGIRHDAYAEAHRIPVEEEKPAAEQGSYLHPELFGQPEEKAVEWATHPEDMRRMKNQRRERELQGR